MAVGKDRDRQGPGNVGAGNAKGNAGNAAKGNAAAASKGAAATKGAAAASANEKDRGFFGGYSGLRDMFDGGGPGASSAAASGTAGMRAGPRARPDVVKTGTGTDAKFFDTRTGQSFAAPSYGALSFKGLTSNDPANVARNRYGREGLEAMRAAREGRDGPSMADRGIASLVAPPTPVVDPVTGQPVAAAPTPADLAGIGAPNTPMAPTFVDTPVYGLPGATPAINYGNAFMGGPQMPPINLMDIFAAYPNFGMR